MISGLPTIDIDDWERHAAYAGVREITDTYYSPALRFSFSSLNLFVGVYSDIAASGMVLGYREDVIAGRYSYLNQFLFSFIGISFADLALLLQFATGSSRVALGGFENLRGMDGVHRFTLCKVIADQPDHLPTASTW